MHKSEIIEKELRKYLPKHWECKYQYLRHQYSWLYEFYWYPPDSTKRVTVCLSFNDLRELFEPEPNPYQKSVLILATAKDYEPVLSEDGKRILKQIAQGSLLEASDKGLLC